MTTCVTGRVIDMRREAGIPNDASVPSSPLCMFHCGFRWRPNVIRPWATDGARGALGTGNLAPPPVARAAAAAEQIDVPGVYMVLFLERRPPSSSTLDPTYSVIASVLPCCAPLLEQFRARIAVRVV